MSDNYRSRTERNHVKNQEKKHIKKKNQRKRLLFQEIPYRLSTSWYRWSCSRRFRFLCYGKGRSKIRQIKLVNPLSTKFLDKTEISFMNTVLKNEHMLLMIKFKSS